MVDYHDRTRTERSAIQYGNTTLREFGGSAISSASQADVDWTPENDVSGQDRIPESNSGYDGESDDEREIV